MDNHYAEAGENNYLLRLDADDIDTIEQRDGEADVLGREAGERSRGVRHCGDHANR